MLAARFGIIAKMRATNRRGIEEWIGKGHSKSESHFTSPPARCYTSGMFRSVCKAVAVSMCLLAAGCLTPTRSSKPADRHTIMADVQAGRFQVDLYVPPGSTPAPLVIVAHGWTRTNANMWGWGEHLAKQGFAVAVPTLPTLSDHPRNARAMAQLVEYLRSSPPSGASIDCSRVGFIGFSSGGLSSFLAAGQAPDAKAWVGLDPVERRGLAERSAAGVRCPQVVLRAEPRGWNHNGNWAAVEAAAPASDGVSLIVNGASHADCELPADPWARWTCGDTSPQRQQVFIDYTTAALRRYLLNDGAASQLLDNAVKDSRVRVSFSRHKSPGGEPSLPEVHW